MSHKKLTYSPGIVRKPEEIAKESMNGRMDGSGEKEKPSGEIIDLPEGYTGNGHPSLITIFERLVVPVILTTAPCTTRVQNHSVAGS